MQAPCRTLTKNVDFEHIENCALNVNTVNVNSGNIDVDPENVNLKTIEGHSSLMWIRGKINGQFLDILLDSGASTSCIAKRCITASPYLKDLQRYPYNGSGLFDVNGNSLSTLFEIRAPFIIGNRHYQ